MRPARASRSLLVKFRAQEPGEIVAVANGNRMDHAPFQAPKRTLYDGHAIAIVRVTGDAGSITVTASTPGTAGCRGDHPGRPAKALVPLRSF